MRVKRQRRRGQEMGKDAGWEGGNLQKVIIPVCGGVEERAPPVRNRKQFDDFNSS